MVNRVRHNRFQIPEVSGLKLIPGMSALGSGYDVFAEYADPNAITMQLFDWTKATMVVVPFDQTMEVPDKVNPIHLEISEYRKMSGTSLESFQSNLNSYTKLSGSYSYFSGSLSVNFNMSELRDSKNEFSTVQQDIAKWALKFDVNDVLSLLKPSVKADLDTLAPEDLFDKYGTHILTGIIVGGKVMMNSATNQVEFKSSYDLELISELQYQSLTFQISAENKTKYAETISSFESKSKTEIQSTGGLAELGGPNLLIENGYKNWSDSVGNNPVFIDFTEDKALTPIWELCTDPKRKQDLINAYVPFATNKSQEVEILPDYITEITVISGDYSEIQAPTGFEKVNFDLNRNAKGKYVYICYKKVNEADIISGKIKPINGLKVVIGNTPPTGYTLIDSDLNAGAGGDYIYVCYKNGTEGDVTNALKDIMVVGAAFPDVYPPEGFERIDQDCNSGARGDYIYICYSIIV